MADRRFNLPPLSGAPQFTARIIAPFTALRIRPAPRAALDTELLHGQGVQVYRQDKAWSLVKAKPLISGSRRKGYVGYVKSAHIGAEDAPRNTARITAMTAPIFAKADIKSHIVMALPMNSGAAVISRAGDFAQIPQGYVHVKHIAQPKDYADDFVTIAEQFLGRPYIWGGTGGIGVDCSGLVQMSLCAAGIDSPRDADQQEVHLGAELTEKSYRRGDLIFWPGHVGIMQNGSKMLHANAYHMKTEGEPLNAAIKRIGPPRRAKRLV